MSASAPNAAWERAPASDPVPGAMYRRQATWRSRLIATSKDHSVLPLSMAPPILPLSMAPPILPLSVAPSILPLSMAPSILPLSMAPSILPLGLAPSIFPPVVSFEEQPGTAQAVMSNEATRLVSRRNERIGELL